MVAEDPARVDTHQHVVPPSYAAWLRDLGMRAGGLPIPTWSAGAAIDMMDDHGIRVGILSISTPGVHLGNDIEARAKAREVNEFAAGVVRDHPERFGFFATLTLPDVDGSLAEAAYALDELHADGVVLLANNAGIYLGDPAFDALFDELQRRNVVVFVHPSAPMGLEPVPGLPAYAVDFLLDTTRAAVKLAASGTLERCPDVKIILSHAGGFLPYAAYRVAPMCSATFDVDEGLARLKRFYFDVALSASPTALPALLAFAQPDHVLYGSDWPYAPTPVVSRFTKGLDSYPLEESQRRSLDHGTAEHLFHRIRRVM